ncbi:DNA-binding MarR family transcriptional regulator [Nocardioides albertanoniae]|uniref:DNA-binding MarR family transcriptional regulator n=1 Tax=Nocardioides albertanoniae TaxID=1175486 RepID=A0A543ACE6_9ACTN|nr:MarR family transcriptional regulator [Nocardioides albertanoniae]TQL70166.1 DNA-binding MarR family transcriptional regulator [Nocardioides albertanoniae]
MEKDDWADRHVARWRDHWIDVEFDDDIEAITVRIGRIMKHLRTTKQEAVKEVGLHDFEYETLHELMIRDTPGQASPSALADDLGISPAGLTGRLDSLEKAGWIQRRADPDDRRRVHVETTTAGTKIWRKAMARRGRYEDDLLAELSATERKTLAGLLKRLTLALEDESRRASL